MKTNGPSRSAANRYSGPGTYRIEIEGELGADWRQRFGDLRMSVRRSSRGECLTVLQGRVRDQATLAGILNTIYELHRPLLSVQRLEDERPPVDANG